MKRILPLLTALVMVFGLSVSAHAVLIDNLNGTITDDTGLMWLQDATLATTKTFGVSGIQASGRMTWYTANNWITGMNAANHLGFNDWRLPTADLACGLSFDCVAGEIGHLFTNELGWGGVGNTDAHPCPSGGCAPIDWSPFTSIQLDNYWTGTEYAGDPNRAWVGSFSATRRRQNATSKHHGHFAWAVRDGDVSAATPPAPVPEPATVVLLGSGLAGLMFNRRRQRKS